MAAGVRSRPILQLVVLSAGLVVASEGGPRDQTVTPDPARTAYMRAHFNQVMTAHEAVIRGDLAAVKPPATWVAEHDAPTPLPAGSAPHFAALKQAAGRAAEATTILAAASATALMLKTCGDCHRAVGTMPAAPLTAPPDVGGIVGHMLQHQQAIDQMLQGLIIPSSSLWRTGAEGLKGAALHSGSLPSDPNLTRQLVASEKRIHQLASQAVRVDDPGARAVFYGQILSRCADCHSLHRRIWGPSRR
jgi:hypothetical protein